MAKLNAQDHIGGRVNKTSICSVVFIDIVDCSLKPVSEQIENKECFNALLSEAIKNIAESDRIILDTGDGAAIALMGSPEDALFAALVIRDGIIQKNREGGQPLYVRIGINLGPVIVVNDINSRLNILGDGINVAQRVMSFADSNQIMVSRSYYEVTSRLTKEITGMFVYSGIKHDKHVREHEVYVIHDSSKTATLAEYPHRQYLSHRNPFKQDFIHQHWLGLAFASFAAVVFVSLALSRLASSGAPLPISADNQDKTAASVQSRITPAEPAIEPTAFVDSVVPPSASDTLQGNRSSNNKRSATQVTVPKDVVLDKKSAQLEHEVAQKAAAKPQYGDLEKKEVSQLSWQSLSRSFKQGSSNRECTQAEKTFNQCQK